MNGASRLYIRYEQWAMRWFGDYASRGADEYPAFTERLLKAHLRTRPDVYIARWLLTVTLAAVIGTIAAGTIVGVGAVSEWFHTTRGRMVGLLALFGVGVLPSLVSYLGYLLYPTLRAERIARDIDAHLTYAVNFLAGLTATGVNLGSTLRSLAQQRVYGAIGAEVALIVRDMELLGLDTVSAIKLAILRSPSQKFQDLLQGVTTTILSGGDLRAFFIAKTEQYSTESVIDLKSHLENIGLFAESYITIGAAAPLFLFTMALVMALIDSSAGSITLVLINIVVFVVMPLTAVIFIYVFKSLRDPYRSM